MIISRYLQRNIYLGTAAALTLLVSLALFFNFVRELDNLEQGRYELAQVAEYLALSLPGSVIEFLPLAVLLGSMLSLGALAGNSELIAMQASGVSQWRMLAAVLQAGLVIAVLGVLLSEWVLPDSEINARKIKNLRQKHSTTLESNQGLWIKDETRIVRVRQLLPNGYARGVEIYQLDSQGRLRSMIRADSAEPRARGWELQRVQQTTIGAERSEALQFDQLVYPGNLSHQLLQVLLLKPRYMSSHDLWAYLQFLDENRLDSKLERLIFWQKMLAPLTIVLMCMLAFPFVTGSQRQSNTGKRMLIGILLGLSFAVIERVLTQLGMQMGLIPIAVALAPNLLFLSFALYLLFGRRSRDFG